ncbi:MAG: DUF3120 domain-containing protein [Stenomitos frigidus ULC029]
MVSYTSASNSNSAVSPAIYLPELHSELSEVSVDSSVKKAEGLQRWLMLAAAVILVSVPVFVQAPLVRLAPWFSLLLTIGWLLLSLRLLARPASERWGDLLIGFTWTWLAGSIYWGWFRSEPLLHLPIEAIGLPIALWGIVRKTGKIGNFFYFGSLFGTVVTDVYFYLVDLIPYWRQLMQVEVDAVQPIFQSAIVQMQTPWGSGWAIVLVSTLFTVAMLPLFSRQLHWWAFSGAVLSTILVDSLFWLAATAS